MTRTANATRQTQLASVAALREVHAAFQFFHLKEKLFREWHELLVQIPAPYLGEAERAAALAGIFESLGMSSSTDTEGNALAALAGAERSAPAILVCAHMDTVFSAGTPLEIRREGERAFVPGASDNGAGLTAMLAIAAAIKSARIKPACDVLFAGTVGEEGEGNLRGMRALFRGPLGARIGAVIAIDGAGTNTAVNQALGSRRFLIEIKGPGGHSWTDAGRPNPIVAMARAIAEFEREPLPEEPATSVNFAAIHGGDSVNSIPEKVSCKVDVRSTAQEEIVRQEVRLHRAIEDAVLATRSEGKHRLRHTIKVMGDRPSGTLAEDSALGEILRVVDRHLQIRTKWRCASTDANIPLSLGVPAVSVGGGGTGGDAHTLQEWFDPEERALALRRILLLLLTLAEAMTQPGHAG